MRSVAQLALLALLALPACAAAPPEDVAPEMPARAAGRPRAVRLAPTIDPEESRDPLTPPSDVAAPIDGARTATGLASKVLRPGTGNTHPVATDRVRVIYTGWTRDGEMFDSSLKHGGSIVLGLGQVIAGWTEGIQSMVEHEKRRFWIPAELAYGDSPKGGKPSGQLTFDIELLEIVRPPETPLDVAAPPADATHTESGLAYRVLEPGTGTAHPGPSDTIEADYSGWSKDGVMFDSSVTRGDSFRFKPDQVIKGWSEVVQLMVEGEKVRVWIPAALAYGDKPRTGTPSGQLTFDIKIYRINPPN